MSKMELAECPLNKMTTLKTLCEKQLAEFKEKFPRFPSFAPNASSYNANLILIESFLSEKQRELLMAVRELIRAILHEKQLDEIKKALEID